MVTLLLTEKGGETKQLSFDKDEVTIGRVQGNDLVLPKGNVSKRHCRIMVQGSRFSVEDLKSTNGTYINGRKIGEPTAISGTDKIYVGDFVLKVENAERDGRRGRRRGRLAQHRPPPPPAAAAGARSPDRHHARHGRGGAGRDPGARQRPRATCRRRRPPPAATARFRSHRSTIRPGPTATKAIWLRRRPPRSTSTRRRCRRDRGCRCRRSSRPALAGRRRATEDELAHARSPRPHAPRASPHRPSARLSPVPTSPDGLASWMREQLASEGASAIYVTGSQVEIERNGRRDRRRAAARASPWRPRCARSPPAAARARPATPGWSTCCCPRTPAWRPSSRRSRPSCAPPSRSSRPRATRSRTWP